MAKVISISELYTLPHKYMTAKILEKRDEIASKANASAKSALADWQSSAPHDTGFTQNAFEVTTDSKYTSSVRVADPYRPDSRATMLVVNSQNARPGPNANFLTRFRNRNSRSFYSKIK